MEARGGLPPVSQGGLAQGTSHRPNVLACDKTGKYVLWFFCIGTTEPEYPAAMLAVAVADKPAGPFTFVGQRNTAEEHGWGQDLGLFKDQDGNRRGEDAEPRPVGPLGERRELNRESI